MKKLFIALALCAGLVSVARAARSSVAKTTEAEKRGASKETKYICSIGDMSDSVLTEVYKNREECNKYCKGFAAVCEETGINTDVDITDVD